VESLEKEESESKSLKTEFEDVEKDTSSASRKTPQQLRKASPSFGASSRVNRSLLKPPMSPMLQNKGHSLLKASPAAAPKSPFDVFSPSDSDMD